jgi:hypothetical protein
MPTSSLSTGAQFLWAGWHMQLVIEQMSWPPESVPESVLRDVFQVRLPSLVSEARRAIRKRARRGRTAIAVEWHEMLGAGEADSRSDLARRMGVSKARVTQVLGPASSA